MQDTSLADAPPTDTPEDRRGLHYPHGRFTPEPDTLFEVAPGVFWLRMPLPFSLDHINLWVLDDGNGWAIVDTGLNTGQGKKTWAGLFAGALAGKPVTRVIVTHYHPDHLGLAGWLCERWGLPLEIARTEYLLARTLTLDVRDAPPPEAVAFYARAAWPEERLDALKARSWGGFSKAVSPLPAGFKRIRDGDVLTIGGRAWRIVTGRGHSPEHSCLVCDEAGLMLAGDQVLPRITSNVSVYPTEPDADPLKDWLDSIEMLRHLDAGMRVLPAHNEPFDGLHTRLDQLRDDHLDKLEKLEAFCATPRTVFETFPILFRRPVGDDVMMASGEALAHLHWLENRGQVVRDRDGAVDRFVRA
ncbi:MBL fold metallo-hydrolase [Sphingosinicellaceae bacterium]|nr:MBL fold metallo-hydrolase [Sphingosinicellaceae bacterium]